MVLTLKRYNIVKIDQSSQGRNSAGSFPIYTSTRLEILTKQPLPGVDQWVFPSYSFQE